MGTTNAYNETYTYDANGNIKTLDRYDGAATPAKIDGLTYGYNLDGNGKLINNRLRHVKDTRSSSLCDYDIDDQNDDNYLYDAIGNLTKDNAEEIDNIEWNAYGKISKITRATGSQKSNLEFIYDAMGNRVCKIEKPYNLTSTGWKYTFYVRDASGNIMTTYTKTGSEIENNVLKLDEVMLYGSSRIGTREVNALLPGLAVPTTTFSRSLGLKRYEVSNHLGNVLTTFTDRKYQIQSSGLVTGYKTYIASSQDYYPFGMIMNERKWNTSSYKFGFNGKEMDNEVSGTGNSYDLGARIYNPRIGKMLSPDPRESEYPWQSTYAYYANTPISLLDFNGEGDYYSKNGKHLGSDGRTKTVGKGKDAKQVADDKAYVSSDEIIKKYTNKEGVVDWDAIQGDKGTTDLTTKYGLSNTNLLNRANWAYGEGGGFYLDYYAHAINNLRKHGVWGPANKPYKSDEEMFKNKMTHKVNKKIINLYPGYFSGTAGSPSAQKFAKARGDLNTLTDDSKMRDAIGAIIGSVMGTTKDPTNGAYQWVGGEGTGGPLSKFPEKNNATNVTNVTSGKGKGMRYHTFYSILEE